MVHKRKGRPNEGWRVWVTLPGFGEVGPWQTGLHKKAQAARVEAWLKEAALTRPEIVRGIVDGRYSLQEAWVANLTGQVDQLLAGIHDPTLEKAVREYRGRVKDDPAKVGLDHLLSFAPEDARLSWLRESAPVRGQQAPRNVSRLYERAIDDGYNPNTVRRQIHRAVRGLLIHHLGEEEAEARLRGVSVPRADDTRDVQVTPDQVLALIQGSPVDRFRWFVAAAILTTSDRGPLLRCVAGDFDGEAFGIRDTKNAYRKRTIDATWEPLNTVLRLATAGLEPHERVFPWTEGQVRHLWNALRDDVAGRPARWHREKGEDDPVGDRARDLYQRERIVTLPVLRIKDLRHLLPTALRAAGSTEDEIQELLGHAPGSKETARYLSKVGDPKSLTKAAEALGVGTLHLRAG